jgi:hypothetical protein
MRNIQSILLTTFAAGAVFTHSAFAQFTIESLSMSGGGVSIGGAYTLTGTVGQADAGKLAGGSYSLSGGFWNVLQQAGMPQLSATLRAGNLVLSWPSASAGFVLESTTQLVPGNAGWIIFPAGVTKVGDQFELSIALGAVPLERFRFFRLRSP